MSKFKSTKTYKSNKGFSCTFRQFKATSHCKYLHGYSLEINLEFEANTLDERNWVVDFGGLKDLENKFTDRWLNDSEFEGRCKVTKVEVSEHGANSAIYLP